jgi:peptide chain release factor 2
MYTRWAERQRYKVELLEVHDGEEAGIKSATLWSRATMPMAG